MSSIMYVTLHLSMLYSFIHIAYTMKQMLKWIKFEIFITFSNFPDVQLVQCQNHARYLWKFLIKKIDWLHIVDWSEVMQVMINGCRINERVFCLFIDPSPNAVLKPMNMTAVFGYYASFRNLRFFFNNITSAISVHYTIMINLYSVGKIE